MKNRFYALMSVLLAAGPVAAQDVPKAEWFLGYNYVRVNSTTNISSYSSNGGSSQLALNFGKWVSAVADIGGYHKNVVTLAPSLDITTEEMDLAIVLLDQVLTRAARE